MTEIAIPVLNEERILAQNIVRILDYISHNKVGDSAIQLVIADNGSVDKTQEIGEKLAEKYQEVRYLRLDERGVGRALKAAWQTSHAEIVGYMDLDLPTDLKHLRECLSAMEEGQFDILTGSRLLRGAKVSNRSLRRAAVSRIFNRIVRMYFSAHFSDGMCGFKFLRKDVLQPVLKSGAISDGWFFCTEILIVAEHLGLRVGEVPVCWTDNRNSKVKIIPLSLEYLRAMRRLHDVLARQRL